MTGLLLNSYLEPEFCATFPTGCIPIESVQSDGIFRTRWFGNMAQGLDKMPYDSKVEIILPHDRQHVAILVECRSEYGGRLYSGVLRGMHRLNLEVEQCSVVSCGDLYLCSGTCQVCTLTAAAHLSWHVLQEIFRSQRREPYEMVSRHSRQHNPRLSCRVDVTVLT